MPADRVVGMAERTGAVPYDIPGVKFSHVGEKCSFDAFLEEYGLNDPALQQLAHIVRGADTSRLDLTPQSAGCSRSRSALVMSSPTTTKC